MPNVGRPSRDCHTCRQRRVKCDLTRPQCYRCLKLGQQCPGYRDELSARFRDESIASLQSQGGRHRRKKRARVSGSSEQTVNEARMSANQSESEGAYLLGRSSSKHRNLASVQITMYRNPLKTCGSDIDRQLLQYYEVVASAELSGSHTARFWDTIVLQHSQHEPVLWQALVALGSTHWNFVLGGDPGGSCGGQLASLRKYNKAISLLGRYIGQTMHPSRETVLLCCAVLFCAACALGNFEDAQIHSQAGLEIIRHAVMDSGKSMAFHLVSGTDDFKYLLHAYSWIDMQATFCDPGRPPLLGPIADDRTTQELSWIPEEFENPSEAEMALEIIYVRLIHFLMRNRHIKNVPEHQLPPSTMRKKKLLHLQLTCWKSVFDRSLRNESFQKTDMDRCLIAHNQLQYRSLSIVFHGGFEGGPKSRLNFDSELREVLSLIKSILQGPTKHAANASHAQRTFSFSSGLLPQLCGVIFKARDELLRTEALALLKKTQQREGLTDSKSLGQIFEQLALGVDSVNKTKPRAGHISMEQYAYQINDQCTKATTFPVFSLLEEER